MKRRLWVVAVAVLVGCLVPATLALAGGGYSLIAWVSSSGGGTLSAGDYALSGTAGQGEAGPAWTGGAYRLSGGFWQAAPEAERKLYLPVLQR